MEINSFNFLRWNSNPATPDPTALPEGYVMERERYLAMPVIVPGEGLNFYINTAFGVNYPNFGELTLDIVKGTTVVAANIAPLQQDMIGSNYNIYAEATIPALSNGIYQLAIRRGSTVLLLSNYIRGLNSDYSNYTALFRFTNDIDLYYIRFSGLADFYQQFRLPINKVGTDYEQNREQYQEVTTGRYETLLAIDQEFIKFETYYFDEEAHRATVCMLGHSDLYINDKQYTFKTGYKPAPVINSLLTKGTFELYNPEFVQVNRCG